MNTYNATEQAYKNGYETGVKEFAEIVKLEFYRQFDELIPSIMADKIDEIVDELIGKDKENDR